MKGKSRIEVNKYFSNLENQKTFMNKLYNYFQLNSIEEWNKISRKKIIQNGGKSLLLFHYSNDKTNLLTSIYPNYPWKIENIKKNENTKENFKLIENQRKFMQNLAKKLNIKKLDEWLLISRNKLIENGGRSLLKNYYENNMQKLLENIFPNYQWNFDDPYIYINQNLFLNNNNENENNKRKNKNLNINSNNENNLNNLNNNKNNENENENNNLINDNYKENNKTEEILNINNNNNNLNDINDDKENLINENNLNNINNNNNLNNNNENINLNNDNNINNINNDLNNLNNLNKDNKIINKIINFKTIENQRKFMENLYIKLKLKSIDDWINVPKKVISKNGGKKLLFIYENSKKKLLLKIFPNFQFDFKKKIKIKLKKEKKINNENLNLNFNEENFNLNIKLKNLKKSKENQIFILENIFKKLNLISLNDCEKISKKIILSFAGGKKLLKIYSTKKKLLQTIYPNFPWNFNNENSNENFINYFMDYFNANNLKMNFNNFNFDIFFNNYFINENNLKNNNNLNNNNDNDNEINNNISLNNNENNNLINITDNNMNNNLISNNNNNNNMNNNLNNQIENNILNNKIENRNYNLNEENKIIKNKHKIRLSDIKKDKKLKIKIINEIINSNLENQRNFFINLIKKMKLRSIDQILSIDMKKFYYYGGKPILEFYQNNLKKLLIHLFPDRIWFDRDQFNDQNNHQKIMQILFKILKLKNFQDWKYVTKKEMVKKGARNLLQFYQFDQEKLLFSIFPDQFSSDYQTKIFVKKSDKKKFEFKKEKLNEIQRKFQIKSKKDWYRLPNRIDLVDIFPNLKIVFPDQNWEKNLFKFRSKQFIQRILFIQLNNIYGKFLILENYHHPLFRKGKSFPLELDLFLPSLNFAVEYQGQFILFILFYLFILSYFILSYFCFI